MDINRVNLFLVGAMKAGTTSLVQILSQFEEIYVPPIKEPHYFVDKLPTFYWQRSRFFSIDNYFKKDFPKPLHIADLDSVDHYKTLYSLKGKQQYLLDASTAYLACPGTADKIYKYNPDSKIIIIYRDPVERAFSHYKMRRGLSVEKRSFEEVMKEEIKKYDSKTLEWYSYLGISLYNAQVLSYKNLFEHVLVLSFDELKDKPENIIARISNFLKIESPEDIKLSRSNKSKKLRFEKVFFLLKKTGVKDMLSTILPRKLRHGIFDIISSDESIDRELSIHTEIRLNEIFKQEVGV